MLACMIDGENNAGVGLFGDREFRGHRQATVFFSVSLGTTGPAAQDAEE